MKTEPYDRCMNCGHDLAAHYENGMTTEDDTSSACRAFANRAEIQCPCVGFED